MGWLLASWQGALTTVVTLTSGGIVCFGDYSAYCYGDAVSRGLRTHKGWLMVMFLLVLSIL
eukprot:5466048-Amphidinium_carterae.1